MNLPSSMTSLNLYQIDVIKKRGRIGEGSTTPDVIAMKPFDHSSSLQREEDQEMDTANPSSRRDASISSAPTSKLRRRVQRAKVVLSRHIFWIGPGIVSSVSYLDAGNWVTDLSAGAQFGYALNFIILLSGIFGIFLQILAVRMGAVTGEDLARNTRLLCLPEGPDGEPLKDIRWRKSRIISLIFAYVIAEGALIATELAELIGSAIALNLMFPQIPVWGGVLITSVDVLLILFIYKPKGNTRLLEYLISALVLIVVVCFVILLIKVEPRWGPVFRGYVPSKTIFGPEALYASIGILGAVIMPHSLYLGSHFATIQRMPSIGKEADSKAEKKRLQESPAASTSNPTWRSRFRKTLAMIDPDLVDDKESSTAFPDKQDARWKRMSIADMKIHIPHASWDIGISLFTFAIFVNSAILIVAATAFYYGRGKSEAIGDLYDAFNLLTETLGKAYAILFAVALLAAGQSASITVTLAGQLVSEGFIKWKTNPFIRRLVTRLITLGPSLAVAVAVGRNGLDETLVASQVALSFALPVVLVPLLLITALKSKMMVTEDVDAEMNTGSQEERHTCDEVDAKSGSSKTDLGISDHAESSQLISIAGPSAEEPQEILLQCNDHLSSQAPRNDSIETISHDFSSSKFIIAIGIIIYLVILAADGYTLITTINPNV